MNRGEHFFFFATALWPTFLSSKRFSTRSPQDSQLHPDEKIIIVLEGVQAHFFLVSTYTLFNQIFFFFLSIHKAK